jgi:hypothetical protein
LLGFFSTAHAQVPATIAYQGYLTDADGTPLTEASATLTFRLYDATTNGTAQWTETQVGVPINQGVFAVQLGSVEPLTPSLLGAPLFLSVAVGDASTEELAPRVPLTAVPYSLRAAQLDPAALQAGANVTIAPDADGALVIAAEGGGSGGDAWQLGGNAGTNPATDFLGTMDDAPLEVRVDQARVLRLEPATIDEGPNLIAGWSQNSVGEGVAGATIAGGGDPDGGGTARPNQVEADYGTIGGGKGNTAAGSGATVGGGDRNAATGSQATVSGGLLNAAAGLHTAVGGGIDNAAQARNSTVAGGSNNEASGLSSTVGGGLLNVASGVRATAPGGQGNHARGDFSFAAGFNARAAAEGSFVWSDNALPAADSLVTTAPHQFLIRATGGVGLGTNAPATQLHTAAARNGSDQDPAQHVALIENTSTGTSADVLALKTGRPVLPDANVNFVTFFDGSENVVGQIQGNGSGGVAFASSSGDVAEYLPRLHAGESIQPGDVVGVVGGRVTKQTDGTEHVMVVSDRAIVAGNLPEDGTTAGHELVALLGQVLVRVRGPVDAGDIVVPSGQNDGTAIAVTPEAMTLADHAQGVGRAWEAKRGGGVHTVNVAVGLDRVGALIEQLQHQQAQVDALRHQLNEQRAQVQAQLDALRAQLDASTGPLE